VVSTPTIQSALVPSGSATPPAAPPRSKRPLARPTATKRPPSTQQPAGSTAPPVKKDCEDPYGNRTGC
jgi:hypothetical protein